MVKDVIKETEDKMKKTIIVRKSNGGLFWYTYPH